MPAGDASEPAGEFEGAAELLEAMGPRRAEFEEIGITGYPESHHLISDEETIRAMFVKAQMATHIISQICFDAADDRRLDRQGPPPRHADCRCGSGCPGSVDYTKLMRMSMKIGLGESARFLRHHGNWLSRLLTRQFKPDRAACGARAVRRPTRPRTWPGFHLYTFNEVERTERWRREVLERLEIE